MPCHSCIKLLLGTSCQRIVYRDAYPHPEAARWWVEAGRTIECVEETAQWVRE
jgi:deoxycytidylate deaminase